MERMTKSPNPRRMYDADDEVAENAYRQGYRDAVRDQVVDEAIDEVELDDQELDYDEED
jgi:hypothetical protein